MVSVLNPRMVILGGAFERGRALLLEPVQRVVDESALALTTKTLLTAVAEVEEGAARGAAALALDVVFTRDHVAVLDL